jgi:hypothetical protein
VKVSSGQSRSGQAGTESCGRRGDTLTRPDPRSPAMGAFRWFGDFPALGGSSGRPCTHKKRLQLLVTGERQDEERLHLLLVAFGLAESDPEYDLALTARNLVWRAGAAKITVDLARPPA